MSIFTIISHTPKKNNNKYILIKNIFDISVYKPIILILYFV